MSKPVVKRNSSEIKDSVNKQTIIAAALFLIIGGGMFVYLQDRERAPKDSIIGLWPEEPVRIGRLALAYPHAPAALLDRMGFLEQSGVTNYEIQEFTSGSRGALALGTGAVDMIIFGAAIPPIVEGLEAKIIALNNTGGVELVCMTPGIESLEDLKGKKVGNIGPTASPTIIFDMALSEAGILHDAMEHVTINRTTIVLAMTEKKMVDCFVAQYPLPQEAVKQGAYTVLDHKEIYADGNYPLTFFTVREDFIAKHRDVVERILEAHSKSIKFIVENPREAERLMGEYFAQNGVEMSPEDLRVGLAVHNFTQKISKSVMENMLTVMQKGGVIRRTIPFEELVDCTFGLCIE